MGDVAAGGSCGGVAVVVGLVGVVVHPPVHGPSLCYNS